MSCTSIMFSNAIFLKSDYLEFIFMLDENKLIVTFSQASRWLVCLYSNFFFLKKLKKVGKIRHDLSFSNPVS